MISVLHELVRMVRKFRVEERRMKNGLLIIDMQNVCVGKDASKLFKYDKKMLIDNVNSIMGLYDSENVFYIKKIMKDNWINKLSPIKAFENSVEAELVEELIVVSNNIYNKYEGNAFSNKDLYNKLEELQIDQIDLVGLDGGGCVAMTAIGGIQCGYKVNLIESAIGTMMIKKEKKYRKELINLGAKYI